MNARSIQFSFPLIQNPRLEHIDRATYELGYLLRESVPGEVTESSPMSLEAVQRADAIWHHAENAQATLISGLEALGDLMFVAGANSENALQDQTLANLGPLISHVAQELQFLREISFHTEGALRAQACRTNPRGDQ